MPSQLIQGVEARYALYELDAPARRAIKELWPAITPVMEKAIEAILIASIQDATRKSVDEISAIARAIEHVTLSATSIAWVVAQQSATTRDIAGSIQTAAGNTASASAEILSVEQAAAPSASAFSEIADLTARVSARADDLESKVAAFFSRVRAA